MPPKKKKVKQFKTRAQKAEERRKKRIKIQHDHLAREIGYVKLNKLKIDSIWKKIMTKITLEEMREDIETAWHRFEHWNDSKDFQLSLLMDEYDEAMEQRHMNFRKHCENVDHLILMFRRRVDELKEQYDEALRNLLAQENKEAEDAQKQFQEMEEYLNTILYRLEVENKEQEQAISSDFVVRIDEELDKNATLLQSYRAQTESIFETLWGNMKDVLFSYEHENKDLKRNHDTLKAADDRHTAMMQANIARIQLQYDILKKLKFEEEEKAALDLQLQDIVAQRDYLFNCFDTLRFKLNDNRKFDEDHLRLLTVRSNSIQDFLNKWYKEGEMILKMTAYCRKMEMQSEKVFRYPMATDDVVDMAKVLEDCKLTDVGCYPMLQGFWAKVAHADCKRHMLFEERMYLQKENKALRAQLRTYIEEELAMMDEGTPGQQLKAARALGVEALRPHPIHTMGMKLKDAKGYDPSLVSEGPVPPIVRDAGTMYTENKLFEQKHPWCC